MDEHRITELMQRMSAEVPGQTRFCPEDEVIARYFQGNLAGTKATGLKHHVADCRFCQARIGNLERMGDEIPDQVVPGTILADAKGLVKHSRGRQIRSAPAWATAAVVVLAVLIINVDRPQPEDAPDVIVDAVQSGSDDPRKLRSIDPVALKPTIISPVEGEHITSSALTVRWTEVQGSLHYEIRVVNTEGFIIWNNRVEGTEWQLPANFQLEPGRNYFVRVDAYLAEANTVSSEHILFTVEERIR